jgi:iron(III) transport system permease protein
VARLSSHTLTALIAGLLILFIVVPVGALLVRSVTVTAPMPYAALRAMTVDALGHLDEETRDSQLSRWRNAMNQQQRIEASAAALGFMGVGVDWDRKAEFDAQTRAAEAAVTRLPEVERGRFEEELALATASLHRRIGLAFRLRDMLAPAEFEKLRSGIETRVALSHYTALLEDSRLQRAARNSVMLATLAALLTVSLAYALAYGINRHAIPRATMARYIILLPIVSPPIIISFALVLLFGRHGLITRGLLQDQLGLVSAEQFNIYGLHGLVLAQVLSFVPPAFIVLDNALARHDGRLEEAAATQGAGPWQVFRHVTLPLSRPGLLRAFILVFILAMTDFGNPEVIGANFPLLAEIIYDEIVGFQNFALAAALCVWMLVPALAIYFALERLNRRRVHSGGGAPPELAIPGATRRGLSALGLLFMIAIVGLYATVIFGAFTKIWGVDFGLTLQHFDPASDIYGGTTRLRGVFVVADTARVVAIAALLGGAFGVSVAYVIERLRPPGAQTIGFLALLPAVLPGLIFGIGYVVAFNAPFGMKELSLTGTEAILVINILFGNAFVGVLAGRTALQRLDPALDEAAAILGAGLLRRITHVTVPLLRRALLLGVLYVFVDGMTTLSSIIFLVSPDHQLASVRIFSFAGAARYGLACALSTAIIAIVLTAMIAAWRLERPAKRRAPHIDGETSHAAG